MSEQLHRVVLYTKNEKNRRGDGATPGPSVSEFPHAKTALGWSHKRNQIKNENNFVNISIFKKLQLK